MCYVYEPIMGLFFIICFVSINISLHRYLNTTRRWLDRRGLNLAAVVHSRGATEGWPPDDADFIVDNTATGRLVIYELVPMCKNTRASTHAHEHEHEHASFVRCHRTVTSTNNDKYFFLLIFFAAF